MSAKPVAAVGLLVALALLGIATGLELYLRAAWRAEYQIEPVNTVAQQESESKPDRTSTANGEGLPLGSKEAVVPLVQDHIDPIDGLDFDPEDVQRTFDWILAFYRHIGSSQSSGNHYLFEDAKKRQEAAMKATKGKHVRWTFQVARVGPRGIEVKRLIHWYAFRDGRDLTFFFNRGQTADNHPAKYKVARGGNVIIPVYPNFYPLEDEQFLRRLVAGDSITFSGSIHSFGKGITTWGDLNEILHDNAFVLVNVKIVAVNGQPFE